MFKSRQIRLMGFDTDLPVLQWTFGSLVCRFRGHPLRRWNKPPYVYQKGERECLVIRDQIERCERCGRFALLSTRPK